MTRALVVAAAVLTLAACSAREVDHSLAPPRRVLPAAHYRPLDGLLDSPPLREIVELQIDREAGAIAPRLRDADPRVRARAAFALASLQDTAMVAELIGALGDTSALVRADVAFALGQTPTPAGGAALLARALVETDTAALVVVLDALGRAGTAAELGALSAAPLVAAEDGDARIAGALALAYARMRMRNHTDAAARDWALAALAHEDRAVRQHAAFYFSGARDTLAWVERREDVLAALADLGRGDRAAMHLITALGRLQNPLDLPLFTEWLTTSPDWAVRTNAVRALGVQRTLPAARAATIAALRDASHHVRRAAADALAPATLDAAEADSVQALLSGFVEEPPVHGALLEALANAGRADWVHEHWRALTDPALRRAGLRALVVIPDEAAFESMAEVALDPDSTLAAPAVSALATRRARDMTDALDDRYFEVFASALRTRDLAISSEAASALADSTFRPLGAGPLIQSVLLQMRPAADSEAMVAMVRALGQLRDDTAVPLLRELRAGRPHDLRIAAAAALAAIAGEPASVPPAELPPTRSMQWHWLEQWGAAPRLRVETNRGVIVIELSTEQAPLTVQTLLTLAGEGRFDGIPWHRVVGNFVIQTGDVSRQDGWGGPGFAIRSEFTRIPYLRGTAGMAREAAKDTEGSQWFITHSMTPHLDGAYSAFGTLLQGVDVVDRIREGDRVIRVTAEPTN